MQRKWQLGDLLQKYHEVFAFTPGELGDIHIKELPFIDMGDAPPLHVLG